MRAPNDLRFDMSRPAYSQHTPPLATNRFRLACPDLAADHQSVNTGCISPKRQPPAGFANGNRTCIAPVQFGSVESISFILRSAGTAPHAQSAPQISGVAARWQRTAQEPGTRVTAIHGRTDSYAHSNPLPLLCRPLLCRRFNLRYLGRRAKRADKGRQTGRWLASVRCIDPSWMSKGTARLHNAMFELPRQAPASPRRRACQFAHKIERSRSMACSCKSPTFYPPARH
jgi:hypothetical protein